MEKSPETQNNENYAKSLFQNLKGALQVLEKDRFVDTNKDVGYRQARDIKTGEEIKIPILGIDYLRTFKDLKENIDFLPKELIKEAEEMIIRASIYVSSHDEAKEKNIKKNAQNFPEFKPFSDDEL